MPLSPITSDAQMMSALRQTLSRAAAKQVVSASNLANLSTPGYKAQEVDFDTTLDQQVGGGRLAVTNSRHIGGGDQSVGEYQTRTSEDVAGRRDGNTVQVDRELLNMTRAAGEFAK